MWQWITNFPRWSVKYAATWIVSPGLTKNDSLRQSSHGFGGWPLRDSMYQSVECRWKTWATPVLLVTAQVSVVPSTGNSSERDGSNRLPLISQLGRRPLPPIEMTQVRSGVWWAEATQSGSGRSVAG